MKPSFIISGSQALRTDSSEKENQADNYDGSSCYFSNPTIEKKSVLMRPTFEKQASAKESRAFSMITKPSQLPLGQPQSRQVKKYGGGKEFHDFRSEAFAPSILFKPDYLKPINTPFDYSHEPQRKSTRSQKSIYRRAYFNRQDQQDDSSEVKRHLFEDEDSYPQPYLSENSVSTESTSQHRSSFKTQAGSVDDDDSSFLSRLEEDTFERPAKQFKNSGSCVQPKPILRLAQLENTRDKLFHVLTGLYQQSMYEPSLLPTLEKQKSYSEVAPQTVAEVMGGKVLSEVELLIVDCRFSYEYDGGHIHNAINISDPFILEKLLLHSASDSFQRIKKRVAIILHCEFSSKRGPALYSMIRELDRKLCLSHYPMLLLPEMYVMKGGYSQFFALFPDLCDGGYTTMQEGIPRDNRDTLSHFNQEQNKYRSGLKQMF